MTTRTTLRLRNGALAGLSFVALAAWSTLAVAQAPTLRATVDQAGDFKMIGNSLAYDCGNVGDTPIVGTVPVSCGGFEVDTAPDVFWQSDDQNNSASASIAFFPLDAQSTAVLTLPPGSTVTHAYLYWAGEVGGDQGTQVATPDTIVTFDRPDGAGGTVFTVDVTAGTTYTRAVLTNSDLNNPYDFYQQSVADVSAIVNVQGSGAYRVSGFDLWDVFAEDQEVSFAGWSLVVFYENPSDPPRNLTLFDGFTYVDDVTGSATATLTGFLVPNSGFDAKLGVISYEGDAFFDGDRLLFGQGALDFNLDALSNGLNPVNNFFNSTRTHLGAADNTAGDLPQLAGTADTMAGLDYDVVDITSRVSAGQSSANIEATTTRDVYFLGAFVTSISTFEPNLSTSTKDVVDDDGPPLIEGDELVYTINVVNNGNDNAINTVLTDALPVGVTYVPGSLLIESGPNMGALTDGTGDDQGEYDGGSRTITVRLGDGANSANGGTLDVSETTVVKFRVTVDVGTTGTISNQAEIAYAGEQGAPAAVVVTDGNGGDVGTPSTDIDVNECAEDSDCGGANNGQVCDADDGFTCVLGCRGLGMDSGCPNGDMCTSTDDTIGDCVPDNGSTTGAGVGGSTGTMTGAGGAMSGAGGATSGAGGAMSGAGGAMSSGSGANGLGDDDSIAEDGSCACRTPGNSKDEPWRGLALAGLLGIVALRRRNC